MAIYTQWKPFQHTIRRLNSPTKVILFGILLPVITIQFSLSPAFVLLLQQLHQQRFHPLFLCLLLLVLVQRFYLTVSVSHQISKLARHQHLQQGMRSPPLGEILFFAPLNSPGIMRLAMRVCGLGINRSRKAPRPAHQGKQVRIRILRSSASGQACHANTLSGIR